MKKATRRWSALCLAVLLILSVAVVASAATIASRSFTYDGGSYSATMRKGTQNDKKKEINGASEFEHVKGNVTPILNNISFDITHTETIDSLFASQLYSLLGEVGLQRSCTASGRTGDVYYYAEGNDATGTYALGIRFTCYRGSWSVQMEMPSASGTTYPDDDGKLTNAPTGQWVVEPIKVS